MCKIELYGRQLKRKRERERGEEKCEKKAAGRRRGGFVWADSL